MKLYAHCSKNIIAILRCQLKQSFCTIACAKLGYAVNVGVDFFGVSSFGSGPSIILANLD